MIQWLLLVLSLLLMSPLTAEERVLEPARLHLGRPGAWEWDEYKDRKVDGERWEMRFAAKSNAQEHTLRLWQSNVKLNWPVLLNGKKLGILTTAETPMETLYALPAGALRDGENTLVIEAPSGLDDIEVGPVGILTQSLRSYLEEGRIEVQVTNDADGQALPCRLTLVRSDGTLQPLLAEPAGRVAARTGVVYTRDGRASIMAPAGNYMLYAGRGFEWSVSRKAVRVKSGSPANVALTLRHEVPAEGWIAADSHIHTLTYSGHGDATIEERLLTIAGEGIELAISTDHNHHTDYGPVAASTGTNSWFTPVIGNEVTTKHGHFNAFPIAPDAPVLNANEQDWARLIPAMRATPGVKVITLNHPRDVHNGFVPFGALQFNPNTGRHRDAEALDIDAIEVVTSAALQSDVNLLFRDWFALLNRGHRISAIGSSDSHDVNRFILGQGRTYVAVNDRDPVRIDLEEAWRSYRSGRLLVSLGLLANMKVDGRFSVGDTATRLGETLKVEITVMGPSWIQADHLVLYANGVLIREENLEDAFRPGEKARVTWELPKPKHDVHLVAIATGPGVKEPFWEIPRPYQPSTTTFHPRVLGATNPIWIDANGDGKFESAYAIAQGLVKKTEGDREKLKQELVGFDSAVSTQVNSLTPRTRPADFGYETFCRISLLRRLLFEPGGGGLSRLESSEPSGRDPARVQHQ